MGKRKVPRWVYILAAAVLVLVLLRLTIFRPRPVQVETAAASFGTVEETVTNTRAGTVKARTRAKLSPQIGGRVTSLPYPKGASVKKGTLLLKLDDSVQRAQVALAERELAVADARASEACIAAELAGRDWRRGRELRRDGIISPQELDSLESRRDQTRAACHAAREAFKQAGAQVQLARAEFALTELRAPFSGVLADRSTEVGEWITPSPPGVPIPPVLDVLDPRSIYISAPIDELDSGRVRVGQEVRINIDSRSGETYSGKVSRVAPYVLDLEEQNRTLEIEVDFGKPVLAAGILPGTSADVEVILSRRENVLRIPSSAIAEGKAIMVLNGGRLVERQIKTGLSNWRYSEVLEGLKPGDLVVTARDSTAVKPGARAVSREKKA